MRRTRAGRTATKYKVELSAEEREVLRRAARRYRAQLPTYLVSNQEEARMLRVVLRKL